MDGGLDHRSLIKLKILVWEEYLYGEKGVISCNIMVLEQLYIDGEVVEQVSLMEYHQFI